jgi:hypothetical protein
LAIVGNIPAKFDNDPKAIAIQITIPPSHSFNKNAHKRGGFRESLESGFNTFTRLYTHFVSNIFASILICTLWLALLFVCINVRTFSLKKEKNPINLHRQCSNSRLI